MAPSLRSESHHIAVTPALHTGQAQRSHAAFDLRIAARCGVQNLEKFAVGGEENARGGSSPGVHRPPRTALDTSAPAPDAGQRSKGAPDKGRPIKRWSKSKMMWVVQDEAGRRKARRNKLGPRRNEVGQNQGLVGGQRGWQHMVVEETT
eukprot:1662773-Rhodomonas_salina.1